ncbi:LacI family transcriptional regulator [Bacillus sp. FJAT-18017]|uniref:LacI family DNA-binding transcriptional regulator n=1 Tax=Bacillus sp. FJAT-18017 TaxID=1705566 RepID=UPI0006B03A32|nr:LacI family DNA-binding transcriptional regulator [Bacillus sp. FJAT-18017]ALC91405.1 LacI family transcriptional regulator [Bacillus sp. FJAT-18017]
MVNIKDIAKQAGVSISTVSYALNGSQKVTPETTAKILAIAKELNYTPNAAARNLKRRETKIIGAFFAEYSGAFYGQLLKGMRRTLSQNGYDLIVCSGAQSQRFIPERMIDGAIILDEAFSTDEILRYANLGHKLVVLDREVNHPNITKVLLDNKNGSHLAIGYFEKQNFKNIYILSGPEGSYDTKQRLKGLLEALETRNHMNIEVMGGDFTKSAGEVAAKQLVESYSHPVAIFCLNDEMAIGMYNYLSKTEYRVGEHFHIIGFDNIEVSNYLKPRLTTIDYSKEDWGAIAAGQLMRLLTNEPGEDQQIPVTLLEGKSVNKYNPSN